MYITSVSLTVVGQASGLTCPVKVEWTFGTKTPDVVEVYQGHLSAAERLAQVHIDDEDKPTSTTVQLPAGQPAVTVFASPRLLDDSGTLEDTMPDARGVERDWQSFALSVTIATPARQGTGEVKVPPRRPPTITRLDTAPPVVRVLPPLPPLPVTLPNVVKVPGRIRVHWIAGDDFGKYLVRWVSNDPFGRGNNPLGMDVEKGGRSGVYELVGAIPGVEYSFNVKGGWGWPGWRYTEWSEPVRTIAQPNLRGLRAYLLASGIDPASGVRRYLEADGGSVRSFMQLSAP